MYSKTEQILSRYRPIAPKPPLPKLDGITEAAPLEPQCSSSVSVDRGKKRGSRKRGSDALASPNSQKRALPFNRGLVQNAPGLCKPDANTRLVAAGVPVNDVVENTSTVTMSRKSTEGLDGHQLFYANSGAWEHMRNANGWCETIPGGILLHRAAVAGNPVIPGGTYVGFRMMDMASKVVSWDYGHNMADDRITVVPHVPVSELEKTIEMQSRTESAGSVLVQPMPPSSSYKPASRDTEESSADDDCQKESPKLVTLSLLPETPSDLNCMTKSEKFAARHSQDQDPNNVDGDFDEPLKLSLYMVEEHEHEHEQNKSDASSLHMKHDGGHISKGRKGKEMALDINYLEQAYGASPEPVVLVDTLHNVLWSNPSYSKAVSERAILETQLVGPYIDPLGLPTQLGSFKFSPCALIGQSTAILWGFLKKFVLKRDVVVSESEKVPKLAGIKLPAMKELGEEEDQLANEGHRKNVRGNSNDNDKDQVKMFQPVRAVGSTVYLEDIVETNQFATTLAGSLEAVQRHLEKGVLPAMITDIMNHVKWVNMAYKQLIGQTEYSWLPSCMVNKSDQSIIPQAARLAGEVSFICLAQKPLDVLTSLLCHVSIEWVSDGKKCLITVPGEMRRLDDDQLGSLYVWKLNVPSAKSKSHINIVRKCSSFFDLNET